MNPTPDTSASAGNGGNFDPRQAAALLDQTTQDARRKLAPSPPWLLATSGGRGPGRPRRDLAVRPRAAPLHRAPPPRTSPS